MVAPSMNDAREAILSRVRSARPKPAKVDRSYRRSGELAPDACAALFEERVSDYRADVRRVEAGEVAAAVAAVCAERGARRLVVPAGVPPEWRPAELELVADHALDARALDVLDGALTGCTVAIAETGTIVLSAGPAEGRRSLTLVPDLHVCVVLESQVVELVPDALARIRDLVVDERRPITFVSGPSATSDIELSRVEGVHGPRNLVVLIVKEP
jgi:L-lactate dehydrogenase complex protein LldG